MSQLAGEGMTISFTPHLMPVSRGILTTAYADINGKTSLGELLERYRSFYAGKPFVHILPEGQYPETKNVAGSNYCHIGLALDERTGKVIVVSAIDNLVKGASGQAIQNMNILMGLDQQTGLRHVGLMP
jgi:N-acetyl-gamma-glutamyl-phosphate reductase